MKYLITLICGGMLLINGCCFHKNTSVVEPTIDTPVETPDVSAPQPQPAEPVEPTTSPLPNHQEKVAPQTAEKKASVSTATAATSVSIIPADPPAFANEEILSLEGRNLNPLIHKTPVSDAHINAPWKAEQLKYGIYYSFIKAGTAYIKNRGLVDVSGRQAYLIQTTALSATVIDSIFKVRDVNFSWLDATNFYSLGYSQSLREGRYQRDEWVLFDYPKQTYRGELQKKAEPRGFSGLLTQPVLDMLTSLYYVRS
ncbi:MAG: DUF3108 domain-containing protein, partial [Elusimicrobiaceae bacterium]|nr:DUF3108 domain-containing protein [Elusimicrobiaceae bacterium]